MRIEYREKFGECVSELYIEMDTEPSPTQWMEIRKLVETCFPEDPGEMVKADTP